MKKTSWIISLFVVLLLLSACAKPTNEATLAPDTVDEAVDTGDVVLTVNGQDYTKSGLESLGTISVDYTNKDGETTTYNGVLLSTLFEDAGITESDVNLTFVASDGYEVEAPLGDIIACSNCIVAFDGDDLRIVLPDMDSSLQVKYVVEIKINGSAAETSTAETVLTIAGKEYTEEDIVALGTMEFDYAGSDGQTVTYTSIALSILLEDAEITNESGMLTLVASDGYEVEVSASEVLACSDCILAYNEDGLRTFMPGMDGNLQVKDIIEIRVSEVAE